MKHEMGNLALIVFKKLKLSVDHFIEEFCLWIQGRWGTLAGLWLPGYLLITFQSNHNAELRA